MSTAGWIFALVFAGGVAGLAAVFAYLVHDFRRWWTLTSEL
jgi:hypothetical protein